ncbi:hypothetical protein GCM10027160_52370 [Streptomyces calidiresistens]
MKFLLDKGYQGAGAGVLLPVKRQVNGIPLDEDNRTYNCLLARLRALGETCDGPPQNPLDIPPAHHLRSQPNQ